MGPRRQRVPALEPLAARQNEEERKERQRLHVKRNYYKRMNEMENQRTLVRQLEEEYMRLVAQKQAQTEVPVESMMPSLDTVLPPIDRELLGTLDREIVDNQLADFDGLLDEQLVEFDEILTLSTTEPTQPSKQQQYTDISTLKERLVAENQLLRDLINEYERFTQKLTNLMQSNQQLLPDDVPAYLRGTLVQPLTLTFCQEIARRSAEEKLATQRQSRDSVFVSFEVFGWHDKRLSIGDRVRYSIKKRFLGHSPRELCLRAWDIFSMSESSEALYSTSTTTKYSFLQTADKDHIIMLCASASLDEKHLAKTLFLVTRRKVFNGFLIGFKSLDPKLLMPSELPVDMSEHWVDHISCVTFMPVAGDNAHSEIEFSGDVEFNPLVSRAECLLEMLFYILRFENQLIGPVFSLR